MNAVTKKAAKRIYSIRLLKRAGVAANELVHIYITSIKSIIEHASPAWFFPSTGYLIGQLGVIQRRIDFTPLLCHTSNKWKRRNTSSTTCSHSATKTSTPQDNKLEAQSKYHQSALKELPTPLSLKLVDITMMNSLETSE